MRSQRFCRSGICAVLAALCVVVDLAAGAPADGRIDVISEKLRNDAGSVRVCLWDKPAGFPRGEGGRPFKCLAARASRSAVTITFDRLAYGTYAVSAFHDENDDGQLDMNVLGIPTEGVALIIDGRQTAPPPSFAAFAVQAGPKVRRVTLGFVYF